MNAERLHAIASALQADISTSAVLSNLQQLISALSNQVSQPNQPQYQQQTSQFLIALVDGLKSAAINEFSPTWQQALQELGAWQLMGSSLAEQVEEIFARNQITPSVAQQELQALLIELQAVSTAFDQLLTSSRVLKIGKEDLAPGECELGVLVPRAFVDNRLDRFADELEELDRIFGVFAELSTGSRPSFPIVNRFVCLLRSWLSCRSVRRNCSRTDHCPIQDLARSAKAARRAGQARRGQEESGRP